MHTQLSHLQQACELGVSVGDVAAFAVHQRTDDVAQGGQGQVDLGGLLQPVTCVTQAQGVQSVWVGTLWLIT